MDVSKFEKSPVGRLVPTTILDGEDRLEHVAFVPHPLPAVVQLSDSVLVTLETATLALGRLDGAAQRLPNPWLVARPTIRREAVSSSSLEGTVSTLSDVFTAELLEGDAEDRDTAEVRNYVRAAEMGIAALKELPVSVRLVRNLHRELLQGVRGDSYTVGEIRTSQNWIGPAGCRIEDSEFVPPPPGDELTHGLSDWEKWMNQAAGVPLLVRAAIGHYQFETLHPFDDGNGRLGRLVVLLFLMQEGVLSVPLLDISTWLEARRSRYIDHLRAVSQTGDLNPWCDFFFTGVAQQSEASLSKVNQLLALSESMVAELRFNNVRGIALQIAESLIEAPILTVRSAAERTGKTYQGASNAIDRLVSCGIIEPWPQERFPKLYWAPRVYRLMMA